MNHNAYITKAAGVLLAAMLVFSCFACIAEDKIAPETAANGVFEYLLSSPESQSFEEWVENKLIQSPDSGSEWYAITLTQYGCPFDKMAYAQALIAALGSERVISASESLKYALALCACGYEDDELVKNTLNSSVGTQGVMSYIYGLHLLNNLSYASEDEINSTIDTLLEIRKQDGGWAVMGNYSDTDVSAMAIQALAPYYERREDVKQATDGALEFLAKKQVSGGAFMGFGAQENPESTAQVIIALCALGIDPMSDSRFITDGKTAFDGLLTYRLEDGSFCHALDGGYNSTATVQALMACVAMWRLDNGYGGIYEFSAEDVKNDSLPFIKSSGSEGFKLSYKYIALIAEIALSIVLCVILYIRGKRNVKSYIAVAIALCVIAALTFITNFESASDYYSGEKTEKQEIIGSVTMSIRCDTIANDSENKSYIPEDGTILETMVFEISAGETAFDILTQAARQYGIRLDSRGNSVSMVYVKGINYIYEYDYGEQSGWMYYVNGVAPSVNSGEYRLSDGDVIQWMYSLDIGADLADYIYTPPAED